MEHTSKFIFVGHEWSPGEGQAKFYYRIEHADEIINFVETLSFPLSPVPQMLPSELLENVLHSLLLTLGISYYKLYCPRQLLIEGFSLTKEQAHFWNTLYTKGLGEFFYQNKIDFRGLISFPFSEKASVSSVTFPRKEHSLVGIGGGKDSLVTAELLKKHKKPFTNFMLSENRLQRDISQRIGGEILVVGRQLDPQLLALNNRSDVFNGHVPISAMYAFVGVFAALLYDYSYVIVSNEQSANYGNVQYHGEMINHQWSKSLEFELLFQQYVKAFLTPSVHYFSLLRPLTEIAIVQAFANYPQYFSYFSSCNRNFRITGERPSVRWCGDCPKCAFAFVMLAAFLSKEQILTIFGQDLLAKKELLQIYKELLGVAAFKPFECVGTPEEVQVAFYLAMQKEAYKNDISVQFFEKEVLPKISNIQRLKTEVFAKSDEQHIPKSFAGIII